MFKNPVFSLPKLRIHFLRYTLGIMSRQLELQILRAEESTLKRIQSKLYEQLNRLKVNTVLA